MPLRQPPPTRARVDLLVFFPTESIPLHPSLLIVVPSVSDLLQGNASGVTITTPDFASAISGLSLADQLGLIIDGIDLLLKTLQEGLSGRVFGINLPLIGNSLKEAATFIQDFRTNVLAKLHESLDGAPNKAIGLVQQALFNALGPPGLNWLALDKDRHDAGGDGVPDTAPDFSDVPVESDANHVQFNLHLRQDLFNVTVPIDFDIGIPALNLDVDGNVNIRLGFDLLFGLGISKSDGFYLDTSANNELAVNFEITIPGLAAVGQLFFLQLDVTDDPVAPSNFTGGFAVDFNDPSGDGRLTLSEFSGGADFGSLMSARLSAEADVNLKTVVSFGGDAHWRQA